LNGPVTARERIILALDVPDRASAEKLLDQLEQRLVWVKIGLQLFTREGTEIIRCARERDLKVFLDLKFHDIPATAGHAVESVLKLGVSMTTLHTLGGPAMLAAAAQAAQGSDLLLLGVTLLTSMDAPQADAIGLSTALEEQVLRLGRLAQAAGIGGLVCSPLEVPRLRQELGSSLRLVTPGIRPRGADLGDQKRVLGPSEAIAAGSDWLVIGRPISHAPNPVEAFDRIVGELAQTPN
jgi:orotidine-5'-phosphate decarboxylase